MSNISRDNGFTLTELMISTAIMLVITGAALTTFQNSLMINDSAAQLADANQNLRAGTNQLIKDIMQAGRVIGPQGVPIPSGAGTSPITRPARSGLSLTFNVSTTTNLPDITTGFQLGPTVNGTPTDMITLLAVDAFMPTILTPPTGTIDPNEGTIDPAGANVTLPANSLWLIGDPASDTPALQVGDLVLFKNSRGMAVQTVTNVDATHVYFGANDWFHFNQRNAPQGSVMQLKPASATITTDPWAEQTTLFRLLMITYYVDNTTVPGTPRLVRQLNDFPPQALAGVVEDMDLTYDLVDLVHNPTDVPSLPYTDVGAGVTYNSNQIRKVNIHVGVRSETLSRPTEDYVRNHISTAVDVRSLASVDRYVEQ
jgi:prepilin-type N-terminal cleavage/methylation domain-containing protein